MFKRDKQQVFSLRKYKGYGLASAVIAAFFLSQTVSADVVDNGNGTTTLSNDKASIVVDSSKFKEDNDKTATELFNEGSYEAETVTTGKDSVTVESKTTVKYQTEDGERIDEDVIKTTSETKELDYKVTGKSGKEYTGDNSATSTVNADLEKKDLIEKDGERYKYVRTETTQGEESVLTETAFNDVNVKASVQGMHNNDGSIKYDKIENGTRVWVLEELEDGSYGKYALIENAQNLNDDQIREAAKTATSKFSKAEVDAKGGFKQTDSVVVYETNTYAARKQTSEQFGKDFYYELTANSSKFYKSYIDEIYNVGLDGLEKQGEKYYYKGKEVVTLEDFKTITRQQEDARDLYPTDESNKHYLESFGTYVVATTYYDVLSDFLIAHPESPIFAGNYDKVFWGGDEAYYFKVAFVARLMNDAFKSKYGLNIDTPNFSNKPIDSKAESDRPIEKVTYSFVRTDLKGDADSFASSLYNDDDDLWKHEIGLSYSSENVERVRKWVKGLDSMLGNVATDPFSDKPTSEITKQEYIDVVFNKVYNFYLSTYKDQLTPEQIEELRAKFGDSVFNIVGDRVQFDDTLESGAGYLLQGNGSRVFRNSLGVVTENTEIFTYHDVITPLRAYRLKADENVVRHVYEKVKRGSVIATHKDVEGNELLPQESIKTNEFDGETYATSSKEIPAKVVTDTTPEGFTRTTTTTYTLVENPANKDGNVVGGETITVPYVYRPTHDVTINGSVVATYTTEDGEKLTDDVNVKTDAPEREAYTTEAKEFASKTETSDVNGLTKTTVTRYELIEEPSNKDGNVVGNQTVVVPYVYRKVVTVDIKGSVIATYKDEEGNILASEEKVITNQNAGTYYAAASKLIQASASSKVTENGREVTLITYELIKTPNNETGEVVGGETLVVPYVYRKVVTNKLVPNNPPVVEEETLKVTRFHSDTGEELQSDVAGFEDAPGIIGNYQFTGTTEMNEGNDVQTHIYTKIVTEIPNEAPTVENPTLKVTRYHTDQGEELKADVEGFENADQIIGDYQFTGKTEMNEAGDVQTHIYTKIVTEIPNEAPKVELIDAEVTRYMLEDRETEIADWKPGLHDAEQTIGNYQYTGITENDEDRFVRTHIYKLIETKVPEDAPKLEKEFGHATRYMLEDRVTEIKEAQEGLLEADRIIGKYQFTGVTDQTEDGSVVTHIYKSIETDKPNESPKVDVPEGKVTKYVDESGKEIASDRTGFHEADKTIGKYRFTGKTTIDKDRAVMTHIYKLIEGKVPNDAPIHDKIEYRMTRFVDEEGKDLTLFEYGFVKPKDEIDEFKYTGRSDVDGDVLIHVYSKPKLETKVPGDAPIHEKEALKVTRYVDEDGNIIAEESEGFVPAPKNIEKFEFTGKTELSEDGNIQTHIYRKVVETPEVPEKPETTKTSEKPDTPKTPEVPKKPETPKVSEIPKTPETPAKPEAKQLEKFVKDRLPDTGTESGSLALLGLASLFGSLAFMRRRKED